MLFGTRGLLIFAPVVGIGLAGLYRPRTPASGGRPATKPSSGSPIFVAYLALQAGWPNPWGGEMPGPRYMIPALPLLAPGVAVVWRRTGVWAGARWRGRS